ncbi:uncharacterized protein LOC131628840 [Vicia villosa]|uniref:uncharacterized protein LOC131628840 n=1 Tax=Vicia villosa TaxID=3911 RepID=UPI00273CF313|nr:uncharacterized protein LOC131628840 [Vicia villosa]
MGGDFNATKSDGERKGSSNGWSAESRLFADFIEESRLIDVPASDNQFSWYSGDGKVMSRIYRFLVDDSLIDRWGIMGQRIGPRSILDHCPVWIIINKENWGPEHFMVNNSWFKNKEFLPFVASEWDKIRLKGEEDELRDVVELMSEATRKMWLNLKIKENMLLQKSRVKWDADGDMNNRYFHCAVKARRRGNFINSIQSENSVVESVGEIQEEVMRHFANKFSEPVFQRPSLEGISLKAISYREKCTL